MQLASFVQRLTGPTLGSMLKIFSEKMCGEKLALFTQQHFDSHLFRNNFKTLDLKNRQFWGRKLVKIVKRSHHNVDPGFSFQTFRNSSMLAE
jgi:hypothetical protein